MGTRRRFFGAWGRELRSLDNRLVSILAPTSIPIYLSSGQAVLAAPSLPYVTEETLQDRCYALKRGPRAVAVNLECHAFGGMTKEILSGLEKRYLSPQLELSSQTKWLVQKAWRDSGLPSQHSGDVVETLWVCPQILLQ